MNMKTYKKWWQRVALSLIILLFVSSEYQLFKHEDSVKIETSGIIQGKFESDYACGSKGRYTCYSRYFNVNNKHINVDLKTFTTHNIGENITLIETKDIHYTFLSGLALIINWIIGIIIAIWFILFMIWSIFYSDKKTFHRFFMDLG